MAEAVKTGEAQRDQLIAAAKEESQRMLEQARERIEAEKNHALADIRGEIVRTAILAAKKVAQEELNDASARASVERVLSELKK